MKVILKVKDILEAKGMTQSELSEKSGLTPSQLSIFIRNNGNQLNKLNLTKVAKALGIEKIEDIIEFSDDE